MSEYEIIIFLASDKIQAIEVDGAGSVKNISFNGNKEFTYNANEGIKAFYDSLTDTYSVDEMSDIDSHIYIVDCGAESSVKWALADKIHDCNGADVISLNKLLPLVISRKDLAEKGKTTAVSFMGNVYVYSCNDDMKFDEISAEDETDIAELQAEDFRFLAVFDSIGGNNAELEQKIAELMAERKEKEGICAELQKQVSDYSLEVEALKQRNEELEKMCAVYQLAKLKKTNEKLLKSRQIISVFHSNSQPVHSPFMFKANHNVASGTIVLSGDFLGKLLYLELNKNHYSSYDKDIIAPKNGKIAWLHKQGEGINKQSETFHYRRDILMTALTNIFTKDKASMNDFYIDVAVIGDENDDVDAMIEWYWEQKEAEKIKEKKA